MKKVSQIATVLLVLCLGAALAGCSRGEAPALPSPKIAPPAIKEQGKLYVGVDYEYMPYSGKTKSEKLEGLDIDVASLIANELGLTVEFVEVNHDDLATPITDGSVDVVMSAVLGEVDPSVVAVSGVYAENAPAVFTTASQVDSLKSGGLATARVGVEADTLAAWAVTDKGVMETVPYGNLNEAFDALVAGNVQAVACDAVVGAYLCGHYEGVEFVEQLGSAQLIGVGVAADNTELQAAVQGVLDAANDDGRMKLVRATWVGDLPELSVESSATPVQDDAEQNNSSGSASDSGASTNKGEANGGESGVDDDVKAVEP